MRAFPLAVLLLTLAPAAGALPSPIPSECGFTLPASFCASEASEGCYGQTEAETHSFGYVRVTGSDACGYRSIIVTGSNGATGFFVLRLEGTDSSCTASGSFVLNVFPTTDCSAVGAPANPGWGHLLP